MNEDIKERQNELETRRLNVEARMVAVLPSVIDYVAGLSGFKNKYPEAAAAYASAKEDEAEVVVDLSEWRFRALNNEFVHKDEELLHDGKTYVVLQDHRLQLDWVPGEVPALYRPKADPGVEWPDWVQPTGAHDAYHQGDKVTFEGEHYVSLIDNNVWSPKDYPQGWQKAE